MKSKAMRLWFLSGILVLVLLLVVLRLLSARRERLEEQVLPVSPKDNATVYLPEGGEQQIQESISVETAESSKMGNGRHDYLNNLLDQAMEEMEKERIKRLADKANPVTRIPLYDVCEISKIYRSRKPYQEIKQDLLAEVDDDVTGDAALKYAEERIESFWDEGGLRDQNAYIHLYRAEVVMEFLLKENPDNLAYRDAYLQVLLTATPRLLVAENVPNLAGENCRRGVFQPPTEANERIIDTVTGQFDVIRNMNDREVTPDQWRIIRDCLFEIVDSQRECYYRSGIIVEAIEHLEKWGEHWPYLRDYITHTSPFVHKYKPGSRSFDDYWYPFLTRHTFDNYADMSNGSQEKVYEAWYNMSPVIRVPEFGWQNLVEYAHWDEIEYPDRPEKWLRRADGGWTDETQLSLWYKPIRYLNPEWEGGE